MRYLAVVSYDGSNYAGYQIQPDQVTIQAVIERALEKMHQGRPVKITASGRTDAGVHAHGQVFHFDSELVIPEPNWKKALNSLLPDDIVILQVKKTPPSFHARYDATKKTYKYVILNRDDPSPFEANYSTYIPRKLDISLINQACDDLIGEHDFTAFCAANSYVKGDKIRTIYEANCKRENDKLILSFTGNGFLYHMVRIIVGTLIEIGQGNRPVTDIQKIINSKDRSKAGKTAPAQGLYLNHVEYEREN